MKHTLLILSMLVSGSTFAGYQHNQITDATNWPESQKYVFSVNQTVPIQLLHEGDTATYQIVVNDRVISNPFQLSGSEAIHLDVPVILEHREGNQQIKVCSQSLHGSSQAGAKVCNVVEFNLLTN